MNKFLLLLCVLAINVTGSMAQTLNKKHKASDTYTFDQMEYNRIWKNSAGYLNIAYFNQTLENGILDNLKIKSDWGTSISYGKTFYLHRKPIGKILKFGLDWTWMDINTAGYSIRLYDEYEGLCNSKSYQAEIGMQIGPSITINPIRHLKVGVYFRVTPCYSAYYDVDAETIWGSYSTFINIGTSIAWNVLSVGVEYRSGNAKYKELTNSREQLINTSSILSTSAVRLYFGFRF